MKKLISLLLTFCLIFSCTSAPKSVHHGNLPKKNTNDIDYITNETESTPNEEYSKYSTSDIYFNEIAEKLPDLFENLLPKLRQSGFKKILMKKLTHFAFRVKHNGMEWIVKSFLKRRKYLLDRISLMLTIEFTKFFKHEGLQPIYSDSMKQYNAESDINAISAYAILLIDGKLEAYPLAPLSVTGMEYILRLEYDVQASIIDLKSGAKIWFGYTTWRRNLMATSMD